MPRKSGSDAAVNVLADVLLSPLVWCAAIWVRGGEAAILREGRPLGAAQQAPARAVGVAEPGRVRMMAADVVPMPLPAGLAPAAAAYAGERECDTVRRK